MTRVCKLKKALYGLKQTPRAWFGTIDTFLTSMEFTNSKFDPNFYMKIMDDEPVILLLYVDDLFLTGNEKHIKDGLEVWQGPKVTFLNQGKNVVEILKRFDMLDCKFMATPMDTNLKLLSDETSYLVDMTQYR